MGATGPAERAGAGVPFGRYAIRARLGRGGMGEVFLADQLGPRGPVRPVALKRVLPRFVEDDAAVELFLSEMQTAAQLNHPNIATTYDFGEVDGVYFMTMEYVDGITLDQLLVHHQRIAVPEALTIVLAITDALAHAHTQGVVHQDVTPHNIMVSRTGAVKLLDFGIARAEAAVLKAGVRAKIAYAAPEQLEGHAPDRRFDLWSLGVVLYEAVGGQRPFAPTEAEKVLALARQKRFLPLSGLVPAVEDLDAIVEGALEPDPNRRWLSAETFAAAVRTAANRRAAAADADLAALVAPILAGAKPPDLSETSATGVAAVDRAALAALEGEPEDDRPTLVPGPAVSQTATTSPRGAPQGTRAIERAAGVSTNRRALLALLLVAALVGGVGWLVTRDVGAPISAAVPVKANALDEPTAADTRDVETGKPGAARDEAAPTRSRDAPAEALIERPTKEPAEAAAEKPAAKPAESPREEPAEAAGEEPAEAAGVERAADVETTAVASDPARATRPARKRPRRKRRAPPPPPTEAPGAARVASPPPPPPPSGLGLLSVRSVPWARVALDGRAIGEGVIAKRPVETGRHTLTLRPGEGPYETKTVTFEIRPGVTTKIFADLRTGTVRVEP
ncbi:MAG: serine/threonine-protein kinase [Deltaproteobacteria bacterium]